MYNTDLCCAIPHIGHQWSFEETLITQHGITHTSYSELCFSQYEHSFILISIRISATFARIIRDSRACFVRLKLCLRLERVLSQSFNAFLRAGMRGVRENVSNARRAGTHLINDVPGDRRRGDILHATD